MSRSRHAFTVDVRQMVTFSTCDQASGSTVYVARRPHCGRACPALRPAAHRHSIWGAHCGGLCMHTSRRLTVFSRSGTTLPTGSSDQPSRRGHVYSTGTLAVAVVAPRTAKPCHGATPSLTTAARIRSGVPRQHVDADPDTRSRRLLAASRPRSRETTPILTTGLALLLRRHLLT